MTVFSELKRVDSTFKTAAFFAGDYHKLDDKTKKIFQTQLLMILDPVRVSEISVEDAFRNGLELYCMYNAYHVGKHTKAKEIISRIKYRSALSETLRYIYKEDENRKANSQVRRIRISFIDFWGIDRIEYSFILWALRQRKGVEIEITIPEDADILYSYLIHI